METNSKELTLLYHPEKFDDKKARAFVESLGQFKVKTVDLSKDQITPTQLAQVADQMKIDIYDLVDDQYLETLPKVDKVLDLQAMDDEDILEMVSKRPVLLCTPIIITGDRAYRYGTAYEFVRKGLAIDDIKVQHANADEKTPGD